MYFFSESTIMVVEVLKVNQLNRLGSLHRQLCISENQVEKV